MVWVGRGEGNGGGGRGGVGRGRRRGCGGGGGGGLGGGGGGAEAAGFITVPAVVADLGAAFGGQVGEEGGDEVGAVQTSKLRRVRQWGVER
ncbi:MAG: hypothetical protein RL077_722 [Verrucomicrobiota bacterium]